jgi:uncharacterized membrane protein YdfJ with MMPL/SSD domain
MKEGSLMHKKRLFVVIAVLLLLIVVGCNEAENGQLEENTSSTTGQSSSTSSSAIQGMYVYEKYEGDLPFIITYYTIELKDDSSYHLKNSWTSGNQTATSDNVGTWAVIDGELILTNDSAVEATLEIENDRVVETMYFGYGENQYPVKIYFKKE